MYKTMYDFGYFNVDEKVCVEAGMSFTDDQHRELCQRQPGAWMPET